MHYSQFYCDPPANSPFEDPHFIRAGVNWVFEGEKPKIPIFSGIDSEYQVWKQESLPILDTYPNQLKPILLRNNP